MEIDWGLYHLKICFASRRNIKWKLVKDVDNIQWATLVTHHFFRPHIFWQKYWNRTFSMIIYLLTFYLFDNIEKKILESLMRIILLLKGNFDKFWKMHVQAERLFFLFLFFARHYPWWSLWQKNTNNNLFIQVKPPFLVVLFSNTVTFWINAHFNVILTSVTIIKLGFLRRLSCNESLVDIEVSKHENILSLTRLIALVVVTSSLTSTPWRQ